MDMVLQVDAAGVPQNWLSANDAATLFCNGDVAWSLSPTIAVLHGGWKKSGARSTMDIPAIIATKGVSKIDLMGIEPPLTRHNDKLFARDRYVCAYCGGGFHHEKLTREHVVPLSQKGGDVWNNVVSACSPCNSFKRNRTPEQARMPLLYLPYVPNRYEDFLLRRGGKKILADQMEFLLSRIPRGSRCLL